jgi:hypothetical protein
MKRIKLVFAKGKGQRAAVAGQKAIFVFLTFFINQQFKPQTS